MTRKVELPKRRRILGVMGSAGFAALAGCGSSGDDDGDSDTQEAQFDVTISSTNQPVSDGSLLKVTATVENVGEEEATDEVMFMVESVEKSTSVTLGAGEQQDVSFERRLQTDQANQTVEATVETTNGSDSREVTVFKESFFEIKLESFTDELVAGELFEATVRVENTGGEETTQTVRLDVVGMEDNPDSTEVTLGAEESRTLTLEWVTEGAAWAEEVEIRTDDDSVSGQISVAEDAVVNYNIVGATTPLVAGETLEVDVEVINESGAEDTVTVALDVPGVQDNVDSMDVTVGGGSSRTVTLSWVADDTDATQVRVRMRDGAKTRDILVREPANFEFEVEDITDSVYPAETVEVEAFTRNTGQVEGTTEIAFTGPDGATDSRSITILGGGQDTVTFEWTPGIDHIGTQEMTLDHGAQRTQLSVTVDYPLELVDSALVGTDEFWAEQIEITLQNNAPIEFTEVIAGELETDETNTNRREVTVPASSEQTYSLKVIHGSFPVALQDVSPTIDARIDKEAENVSEPADYERLVMVKGEQNFNDGVLTIDCEVENPTDQEATATAFGEVSVRSSPDDVEVFDDSRELTLSPDQSEAFQLVIEFQSGFTEDVFWSVGFRGVADMLEGI